MRIKLVVLAIGGAFAFGGCQSKAENKNASVGNTAQVVINPANKVSSAPATADSSASDDAPKISGRQFEQIKLGMSKAEVEKIIGAGKPGKSLSDATTAGESYRWSIGGKTPVSITFENGEAADISQEAEMDND